MADTNQECGTANCKNKVMTEDRDRFIRCWRNGLRAQGVQSDAGGPIPRPFYCKPCLDKMKLPA